MVSRSASPVSPRRTRRLSPKARLRIRNRNARGNDRTNRLDDKSSIPPLEWDEREAVASDYERMYAD
jgi:hypothetical protein